VGVCGHELSEMMTGVSSMTSTVEEVRLFLKELHLYLKHHQTRGGSDSGVHVPITAGDISACLGSMAHMEAQVKEVQDLLLYFGDRIEESSDSELRFSVNEMYVALDSVSGLSIGGVDSDRERAIIHRLIDLIRQRSC
jgi:3-deoxy-D-arabino-heptulosonate 7-phosphate (DAHP) synthase class II